MMSRKHFERIAQVFRVNKVDKPVLASMISPLHMEREEVWTNLLNDMCIELKAINPRFDEEKFRKACNGV